MVEKIDIISPCSFCRERKKCLKETSEQELKIIYNHWIFSSSLYFRFRLVRNEGSEEIAEKEEEGGEGTEGEVGD